MCSTVDIKDVHNSIKPIITKVKTGALPDDEDETCLEDYRQLFVDASEAEVEMLRNQDSAKDQEIEEIEGGARRAAGGEDGEDAWAQDAQYSKEKKYEEMTMFYERLAGKIAIYDPLNRPILDIDECDMGTTRDQLVIEINAMEQLNAGDLDIMISPENQDRLDELFDKQENEVKNICDEYIREAKESGSSQAVGEGKMSVSDHPKVVNHLKILEFFAKEMLLSDANHRLESFKSMVEGADEQIKRIRSQQANSVLSKIVTETSNVIYVRYRDKNYPSLVKVLMGL